MDTAKAANSSGFASLAGKGTVASSCSRNSGVICSIIGVATTPGAMALTRIPNDARSRAPVIDRAATAPFDAA